MIVDFDYIKLRINCTNCGVELESRPVYQFGLVLKGCEPMQHKHIANSLCSRPKPYSDWHHHDDYFAKVNHEQS